MGEEKALDELAVALLKDREVSVRRAAVEGLRGVGGTRAIELLRAALRTASTTTGRDNAKLTADLVESLGRMRDEASEEVIASLLQDQRSHDHVRCAAATALARLNGTRAVRGLLVALSNDPSPSVRRTAAAELGRFEDPHAALALTIALEDDDDPVTRGIAAISLAGIAGPQAAQSLVPLLSSNEPRALRGFAAVALGLTGADSAPGVLRTLLGATGENDSVRGAAAIGLGLMRDRGSREALAGITLDAHADPSLRRWASRALSLISAPDDEETPDPVPFTSRHLPARAGIVAGR